MNERTLSSFLRLSVALFLLCNISARAQIGNVVKLEYDQLSKSSYAIHLDVTRNCAEDSLPESHSIVFRNDISGNTVSGTLTLASVTPISFYCRSAVKGCQSPNSSNQGNGRELLRYSDTFDISSGALGSLLGTDCILEVWAYGNRDSSNTARLNAAVYTAWNTCLETASSPRIKHILPGTVYEDRAIRYAPSITKSLPSDSLVISRETALDSIASTANYLSGFGSNQPFTPFCIPNTSCAPKPSSNPPEGVYFDSRQGYFVAMPTAFDQVASLNYAYTWYRQVNGTMTWIGTMHHESEFSIIKGGGNTPEILVDNQQALLHQRQFLVGKQGCIDLSISDLDNNNNGSDTNQLLLTNSVANSTFEWLDSSAKSKVGRFCFTPDSTQIHQPLLANFMAVDDHCVLPEQASINIILRADSLRIRGRVVKSVQCQNVSLQFNYTASEFLPLNYRWTVNGMPAGNTDSIGFTTASTGTIPYQIEVTSLLSADTLIIQDSVTISTIFTTELTVDPAYCSEDTVVLKPVISGGTAPFSTQWNGISQDSFTWMVSCDTAIQLEVSDSEGCKTILLDTLRESTAEIVLTGPNQTCQNGNIFELMGMPVSGTWGFGGNVLVVQPDTLQVGLNQLPFTYQDSLGCVFTQLYDVDVLESPKLPLDSLALCRGEVETLPQLDIGEWSGNGVNDNVFYSDALSPGLHTIYYSASKSNGCALTDSIQVSVKTIPEVSIEPVPPLCKNSQEVVIRFEPKAGALTGLNVTDSVFTPGFELPDSVPLRVDYTAPNGCAGSDSTVLVFKATPRAEFEGDPLWGDFPLTVAFNNLSEGGGNWFWDFGDAGSGASNFSNQRHPNHTYAFNGTYDVTLAATDPFSGCSDTLTKEGMIKATANITPTEQSMLKLYPVPFSSHLEMELPMAGGIRIFSTTGKLVYEVKTTSTHTVVQTESWPSGIYLIQYNADGKTQQQKVVKLH